jgi:hypothetical protein
VVATAIGRPDGGTAPAVRRRGNFPSMPIYRQTEGVLAEDLDGKAAIVDPEGAELITLNLVGSLVWSLLDGHRDVDAVVSAVVEACAPVERSTVDVDVRAFLAELTSLNLVVAADE